MEDRTFYYKNLYAPAGIAMALEKFAANYSNLVIVFIGTDCNVGDSLAPLAATLVEFENSLIFTYGSLFCPITAKEAPFIAQFVKKAHPDSFIIAVDAAVGEKSEIGQIKVQNIGLKPGLGVNKDLPRIGNCSVIGVLSEKSHLSMVNLNLTRVSDVYAMASVIADAIKIFAERRKNNVKTLNYVGEI